MKGFIMDVYVQSAGREPEHDYCWLSVCKKGRFFRKYPPHICEINRLIQSEASSVLLNRYDEDLVLVVTGLRAKERKDYCGRTVRNSVLWAGSVNEEKAFRHLAAKILLDLKDGKGEIIDIIDNAIDFSENFNINEENMEELKAGELSEEEFNEVKNILLEFQNDKINQKDLVEKLAKVNFDSETKDYKIRMIVNYFNFGFYFDKDRLTGLLRDHYKFDFSSTEERRKIILKKMIAKNTCDRIEELVRDLTLDEFSKVVEKLNFFPSVVVTDKKNPETLKEANIWRGLSNLVESEDWEITGKLKSSKKKNNPPSAFVTAGNIIPHMEMGKIKDFEDKVKKILREKSRPVIKEIENIIKHLKDRHDANNKG